MSSDTNSPLPSACSIANRAERERSFPSSMTARWLERPEAFAFDPDLALGEGHQYPAADRKNFGIFLDSSPDRWGRVLMERCASARPWMDPSSTATPHLPL